MEDLLKKVLHTSIGVIATATEKVQGTVDDLVDKDKLNKEEGKKILTDFVNATEGKKSELEDKLGEMVEGIINRLNLAKKSEVEALNKRIQTLEKELNISSEVASDESE